MAPAYMTKFVLRSLALAARNVRVGIFAQLKLVVVTVFVSRTTTVYQDQVPQISPEYLWMKGHRRSLVVKTQINEHSGQER
jgi:hypothetical protein